MRSEQFQRNINMLIQQRKYYQQQIDKINEDIIDLTKMLEDAKLKELSGKHQ